MSSSLRWRIVLVVVVALFALALVWPTIRWATLGSAKTETLQLAHAAVSGLTAKEVLGLEYYRWDLELRDDLDFTRALLKIRKKADKDKRRDEIYKERQALSDTLAADSKAKMETPEYKALAPYEKAQALIRLEMKARRPREASLWRNVRHDVYRWWAGDEDKILRLGLDLQGGIYMVLRTEPRYQDQVYQKLKSRIDQFGVAEPLLQKRGRSHIIIQLPGATDREKAQRLITERAVMTWMLVEEDLMKEPGYNDPTKLLNLYDSTVKELDDSDKDEEGNLVNFTKFDQVMAEGGKIPEGTILRVLEDTDVTGRTTRIPLLLRASDDPPWVISGEDLDGPSCAESRDSYGRPAVSFKISSTQGRLRLKNTTSLYSAESDHAIREGNTTRGWRLAILLDDRVVSAPQIATTLSDRGQITGLENVEEAKMLALQLRTGSLPAEIDIEENLKVGPSLSGASIQMGWRAAIVGLAAVVLFMGIYYRLSGVFAVVALGINMVLILGALAAAGATLTLPGIAGIILTIGMAVDANVLIFERIREELGAAKKIKAAIDAGYHKALRTILDANITTLITAAVLFFLGTGPVRGFAVTLSIGICTSVFAALVVTRVLFDLLLLNKSVATLKMFRFFEQPKIDFVSVRRIAITGSAVLIAFGLFAFGWGGSENFGIDFTGGSQYRFEFKEPVDTTKVRDALRELGVHNARVQEFDVPASGEVRKVLVQVRESANYDMTLDGAETEAAVRAALEKINVDPNRIRRINTAVEGTTTISFQLPGEAQTDLPAKLAQALGATLTKQQVQPTATEAPAAGEGPPATTATYTITVDGVVTADDVRAKLLGLEVAESDIAQLAATPSGQTHLTMELRGAPRGTLMPELADALGVELLDGKATSIFGDLPDYIEKHVGALEDWSVDSISESLSSALARQTLVAFVLAMCGILVYVSWRFEFKFALGAIIALFHDVLITLGCFAGFFILARRQINAPTIAAFLTIVGYSLNDTIVVFDRIREDLKIMKRLDFRTIINTSINQTLSRTVLTSLTTLLVVLALFVLGGQAINDFSFAMLVGIIFGTYSSIFIASPVLLFMERRKAAKAAA